jgi:RecA-family ATPase
MIKDRDTSTQDVSKALDKGIKAVDAEVEKRKKDLAFLTAREAYEQLNAALNQESDQLEQLNAALKQARDDKEKAASIIAEIDEHKNRVGYSIAAIDLDEDILGKKWYDILYRFQTTILDALDCEGGNVVNARAAFDDMTAFLKNTDQAFKNMAEPPEKTDDARIVQEPDGQVHFAFSYDNEDEEWDGVDWLIDSILPASGVSLMFGASNTGKTFASLHFAECIAYGMQWYGHDVKKGFVLYFYLEGGKNLEPRKRAWRKHFNREGTDNIAFVKTHMNFRSDRKFLEETIKYFESIGKNPALIVIDTFSASAIGVNQNNQDEVAAVLMTAQDIVREHETNVMFVHHTNKTGDMNGSQAFINHIETRIELKHEDKTKDDKLLIMHCDKQRDDEKFADIGMELEIVDLGCNSKGKLMKSCVIKYRQLENSKADKDSADKHLILQHLAEYRLANNDLMPTTNQWEKYSTKEAQEKISQIRFRDAHKALISEGRIVGHDGPRNAKIWEEAKQ